MIWVGIGLIIIGLALLALVGILIKPLTKVTDVLNDVKETTKDLPEKVMEILTQIKEVMHNVLNTLHQVNTQLREFSPIFHIIGDVGRDTRKLSSKMVHTVDEFKENQPESITKRHHLEGFYAATTLAVMGFQKGKEMKEKRNVVNDQ